MTPLQQLLSFSKLDWIRIDPNLQILIKLLFNEGHLNSKRNKDFAIMILASTHKKRMKPLDQEFRERLQKLLEETNQSKITFNKGITI